MGRPYVLPLLLALWAPAALAQPVEVASGQDLGAWISLEQRRLEGAERIEAYRAFVLAWASSPLASVAYARLVELGAEQAWTDDEAALARLATVQGRWAEQQAVLARRAEVASVASIDLDAAR